MAHKIPWELLEKIFSGNASQKEYNRYHNWLILAPENEFINTQLKEYYQVNRSLPINFNPDVQKAYQHFESRTKIKSLTKKDFKFKSIWWKAAAVVIIIVSFWWIWSQTQQKDNLKSMVLVTGTTQKFIELTDGSKVWLNYGTEIRYSDNFKVNREVVINGEAYFEVAHDDLHPFRISTGNSQIQVLGTKFNVDAYATNNIENVVVTEGKVSYVTNNKKEILSIGDQGILNKKRGILEKVKNNNPNFLAWKTKMFYFQNDNLDYVFQELSKVYRFKYEIENIELKTRKLTSEFNNMSLPEIFEVITLATKCQITNINDKYIIH